MSKSLKRVVAALSEAGHEIAPLELGPETRTAQQAADAAGCALDQIAKSVIFAGQTSGRAILFITAGGNRVVATAPGDDHWTVDAPFMAKRVTQIAAGGGAFDQFGHLIPAHAGHFQQLLRPIPRAHIKP